MNRNVYLTAFFLIVIASVIFSFKIFYGGQTLQTEHGRNLWNVIVEMHIKGEAKRAKVRMTLPKDTERQTVYNETFENEEMDFYIRERELTSNRIGFWRAEHLGTNKVLRYTFSAQLKSFSYIIPPLANIPKNPFDHYPPALHVWLKPSEHIQSTDEAIKTLLKKRVGKKKNVHEVIRILFDFVRGEVKYKSEKGSKDAKLTLDKLTADCGGQARLFTALSRAAGIPSRIVGGIILTQGIKKITHVWVENYIEGKWIPFDVTNNYFAEIPKDYLELYRGDYALYKHTGLSSFDYFFIVNREKIPPVDQAWSLYSLPIHFQKLVKVLLLIPVGALTVSFARIIVGVPTFGTFAPVLLALAFREVTLGTGLLCLSIVISIGWVFRSLLDRLKILVIPRISILVSLVVVVTICLMIVGYLLGEKQMLYISMFPMIIMTWMVERFCVIQIEDGPLSAFKSLLGTAAVAAITYYFMSMSIIKTYLFAFPEILMIFMAVLLLLGRYTGIRLTEIGRFWALRKVDKTNL